MSDVKSMMIRVPGGPPKFHGLPTNDYGRGKRVTVAQCTGDSKKLGYIEVSTGGGYGTYIHLTRDEIDDVLAALTAVRDAIPAVCKECGQVKPS